MVVPAMEAQGTIGSLIKRRVKATTTCLAFFPQQTTTTNEPSRGGEPGFVLRLTCHATVYISAGNGRKVEWVYPCRAGGAGAEASCLAVPDDEDGIRDALRGMPRSIRALQDQCRPWRGARGTTVKGPEEGGVQAQIYIDPSPIV